MQSDGQSSYACVAPTTVYADECGADTWLITIIIWQMKRNNITLNLIVPTYLPLYNCVLLRLLLYEDSVGTCKCIYLYGFSFVHFNNIIQYIVIQHVCYETAAADQRDVIYRIFFSTFSKKKWKKTTTLSMGIHYNIMYKLY